MRKAIVVSCLAAMTLCLAGCKDKVQAESSAPAATRSQVIANPDGGEKPTGCGSCASDKAKPGK